MAAKEVPDIKRTSVYIKNHHRTLIYNGGPDRFRSTAVEKLMRVRVRGGRQSVFREHHDGNRDNGFNGKQSVAPTLTNRPTGFFFWFLTIRFAPNLNVATHVRNNNPKTRGGWLPGDRPRFSLQYGSSRVLRFYPQTFAVTYTNNCRAREFIIIGGGQTPWGGGYPPPQRPYRYYVLVSTVCRLLTVH